METEVGIIKKLDQVVVNKIAAGEILHRPANAVKELIENCIDAGSSAIKITINGGGLKLIQIQDNGHGISKQDLPLVCERFATSKLTQFEDLQSISTYGFRGEALASISHVAHVTIVSMTDKQNCAYKAFYLDGKLATQKPGTTAEPKPVAGTRGTQITIEDLFYNSLSRRKSLRPANEEYQKIVDIVMKYAVHNAQASFSCKKLGESSGSISTAAQSSSLENIRCLYGQSIARELIRLEIDKRKEKEISFCAEIIATNPNYNTKRSVFILFINHRLVESSNVRKAIEGVYINYLPKGTHPFVYVNLQLPPQSVDVNVHPTKAEVHLLHEVPIIESLQRGLNEHLLQYGASRAFYSMVPQIPIHSPRSHNDVSVSTSSEAPQKKVRTDPRTQTMTSYLQSENMKLRTKERPPDTLGRLTSVQNLLDLIYNNSHQGLEELLSNCVLVGCVNCEHVLMQHRTKLFVLNLLTLSQELFYQQVLHRFSSFGEIRLSSPISVKAVLQLALDQPTSGWTLIDGPKDQIAADLYDRFFEAAEKREMLKEYFNIEIDHQGNLVALPQILDNFAPETGLLPSFCMRLGTEVNWEEEQECFDGIARELSLFYSSSLLGLSSKEETEDPLRDRLWVAQHVVCPALTKLKPPQRFSQDGSVIQIASLENLYKIFERC